MTLRPEKQTIAIHILPNIEERKDKQTMKIGQLIEYNMRNIFLQKSYETCGGETIPRIEQNRAYLGINTLKILRDLFLFYAKMRAIEVC